jgi:hypothetical protein
LLRRFRACIMDFAQPRDAAEVSGWGGATMPLSGSLRLHWCVYNSASRCGA